ncbi:DUF115 domain-containing protein [Pseudodesulfovibrio sp. JC047]|uniref:6-hydroxymethylpterin diphosphokinase MptE-like protein n=1 Tax=Pseudodesulfovibrio sp. JC047 TaxID=2683199 RepID=UPI0013D5BE3E|nr:6-hydroxymethylpterin diphosphokinase MptE-like protein [Pseudodesulfovibrio sp. JC047]NDV20656.1 DUF115 domain-containing protein [Pseudodesulfovibrio sp. JC047]
MENSKIAALVELGILCRGDSVEQAGEGSSDAGPHGPSGHTPVCVYENPMYQYPYEDPARRAFSVFSAKMSVETAMEQTRLVVFLGAADSPQLRACLADAKTVVVLFEPDERVLVHCVDSMGLAALNIENFFCFTGDPVSLSPALQDLLPGALFRMGTPAFFLTDRIRHEHGPWAEAVIEYLEILHYRYVVYPLSGQAFARSRPMRTIKHELMYDQQLHAYENVVDCTVSPSISALKNRAVNGGAILVAAGPDLPESFEYIRKNRDNALIICVNNAVKPLVEAGIHPHFVVINDTSIDSGRVFKEIPRLPDTILVGYCLSDLGGDTFGRKFLFGSFASPVFETREMFRLHGSVISTAFALARHLGCTSCALVGAQLVSSDPWGLQYARGTLKDEIMAQEKPLINRYPQLYPVKTVFGEQLYTTINFRDAALWLAETIRMSGVACWNTSRSSILYGPGIEHDPEPDLGTTPVRRVMAEAFRVASPRVDREKVRHFVQRETALWRSIRKAVTMVLADSGPLFEAKGLAILAHFDATNVTYLVQRYNDFNNAIFHRQVFGSDTTSRESGLRSYFEYVRSMSETLLTALEKADQSF